MVCVVFEIGKELLTCSQAAVYAVLEKDCGHEGSN
jgi:hypothetical protein